MKQKNTSSGLSFLGLLQVAFIVLKLCDVIKWGWLWVLSPTWISAIIVVLLIVAFVIFNDKL